MVGLVIARTGASIMVMINFLFGILVFQEPVAAIWDTFIVGLAGMSKSSATAPEQEQDGSDYDVDGQIIHDQLLKEGSTPIIDLWNGRISLTKWQSVILGGGGTNGIMTGASWFPVHSAESE
jgi:hypothetical protein